MTQKQALDILKLGHNVYLTGAAGSGKTYLLNQFIEYLKRKNIAHGITASTGIAANHLGGITLNSWAGIGIKKVVDDRFIEELFKRPYLRKRVAETKALIIDEVSMLADYQLEIADAICRVFKNINAPFGGIQIVLCGDFFQLPPVETNFRQTPFIFHSSLWDKLDLRICYLDSEYRQEDYQFLEILHEIRHNQMSSRSGKLLASRLYKELNIPALPTRLYTHNANVDLINQGELMKLSGRAFAYPMRERGSEYLLSMLKKNSLVPETLVLKLGAQVMFVKNNFEKRYVNGMLGKVVNFDEKEQPVVETVHGDIITVTPAEWTIEEEGNVRASIKQLPLRLAWALTIHKSQGMNLDAAEIDLGRPFAPGMGYVALSRVRSLDGIKLLGLNRKALEVNREVVKFDRILREQSKRSVSELHQLEWLEKQNRQSHVARMMRKRIPINHILPSTIL